MKAVSLDSLKRFITMMVNYLVSKMLRVDKNHMINTLTKITHEYLAERGIQIEEGSHITDIQKWIQNTFG